MKECYHCSVKYKICENECTNIRSCYGQTDEFVLLGSIDDDKLKYQEYKDKECTKFVDSKYLICGFCSDWGTVNCGYLPEWNYWYLIIIIVPIVFLILILLLYKYFKKRPERVYNKETGMFELDSIGEIEK